MGRIIQPLADFLRNEEGPTAVESAILLALVMVVCVGAIGASGCASPSKK